MFPYANQQKSLFFETIYDPMVIYCIFDKKKNYSKIAMHLIFTRPKPSLLTLLVLSIGILFTSCSDLKEIDNQYLTIQVPKDYMDMTDFDNEDVLFLDRLGEDGLESILSIDNEVDFITQPNSQTIQEDTPVEVLVRRLRSIEDAAENDPNFRWTRFRLVEEAKATTFKGLPAAEGVFEVQEYMKRTDQVVKKSQAHRYFYGRRFVEYCISAFSSTAVYHRNGSI